jgi:hypothetical protein
MKLYLISAVLFASTLSAQREMQNLPADLRDQSDQNVTCTLTASDLNPIAYNLAAALVAAQGIPCRTPAAYTQLSKCLTDYASQSEVPLSYFADQLRYLLQTDPQLTALIKDLKECLNDSLRIIARLLTYLRESQMTASSLASFSALAIAAAELKKDVPSHPVQPLVKVKTEPKATALDYTDPLVFIKEFLDITKNPDKPLDYWVDQIHGLFKDPKFRNFNADISTAAAKRDANQIGLLFMKYQQNFSPALRTLIMNNLGAVRKALTYRVRR